MLAKIKTTWHYAVLSLTSVLEVWWFLITLACGAGLGFAGEHIYSNLGSKADAVVWNPWILATFAFSLLLAVILVWWSVLRHIRGRQMFRKMKSEIFGAQKEILKLQKHTLELTNRIFELENAKTGPETRQGDTSAASSEEKQNVFLLEHKPTAEKKALMRPNTVFSWKDHWLQWKEYLTIFDLDRNRRDR